MIARIWRGVTPAEKAEEYDQYLRTTGLKDYTATEGNQGVLILRRFNDGRAEFMLISLWESLEAIRRFASDDIDRAVYYPEDENYLLSLDPHVDHYELLVKE